MTNAVIYALELADMSQTGCTLRLLIYIVVQRKFGTEFHVARKKFTCMNIWTIS